MTGKRIDVLSDSTGETAEKVVRAAMLQFPHSGTQIVLHTRVRTKEAARPYLEAAARDGALSFGLHRGQPRAARVHSYSELRAEDRGARSHRLAHRQAGRVPRSPADQHAERDAPALRRVLPAHRGGGVHRQERRRQGAAQLPQGRHHPRRRQPHLEDAALHPPRPARSQDREPPAGARREPASRARRGRRKIASSVSPSASTSWSRSARRA